MANISESSIVSRGLKIAHSNTKAKSPDISKDFQKGMILFAEKMAVEFVKYVAERTEEKYLVPVLGISMTKTELLNTISQKDSIVTINKGKKEEFSYWEIWRYFEYGRMDQGVIADPILKRIFIEFRPVYIESLKKELQKKKR